MRATPRSSGHDSVALGRLVHIERRVSGVESRLLSRTRLSGLGQAGAYGLLTGETVAHYEYSPFGEIVVQSGELAEKFTRRYSTKPWCGVTRLSEYLFRKYGPGMGGGHQETQLRRRIAPISITVWKTVLQTK